MKKSLYFAIASLALVGCSDEFLGEGQGTGVKENLDNAIMFKSSFKGLTRADKVGAEAADLLGKNFVVMGTKGGTIGTPSSVVTTTVFDHYNVKWTENTAGTTASNTADWEYVGITPLHAYATAHGISEQSIKYWDYSAGQYDFIAYSGGKNAAAKLVYDAAAAGKLFVTPITPATATIAASGGAYKVTGAVADLADFYIADLVTVPQAQYGNEVSIRFRNITAKVRVGLYETVPGYSIRDVEFYASDDATEKVASDVLTLYSQSPNIYSDGTYTIYYPTVNKEGTDTDNNKAHVSFSASTSGAATTSSYAALDYNNAKTLEGAAGSKTEKKYLGETSNNATYVINSTTKDYTTVLPNEAATALTLRVNYTLVSNDGSNETIKVWGAKAVVPAQYTQWKSNYAYTYLFKISDNTNGATEKLGGAVEGLHPITFDAVVTDSEDGIQETVTTVATPSITTYSPGVQPTANSEYLPSKDIYLMVSDKDKQGSVVNDLTTNGKLMVVTSGDGAAPISEATVMDAMNMGTVDSDVTTGRNGIVLSRVYPEATVTSIPGADGNDITKVTVNGTETAIAASNVVKFTTGASGTVYAYVYFFETGTPSTYNTAVIPANGTDVSSGYYTDFACTTPATGTANGTDVYYQLLTNNNNKYAVKVIKVQ